MPLSKEIFLWRLSTSVLWSLLLHVIFLWMYLCVIHVNIMNPLQWVIAPLLLLTTLSTWGRLLPAACLLFLLGGYQGKDYLQPQPTYATRFSFYKHIFSLHNLLLCGLHMVSGGFTVWLYLSMLGGHTTTLIIPCQQYNETINKCLQEGNLFLLIGGLWFGMFYFLKDHALAPAIVNFPPIQQSKFIQVKSSLGNIFKKAMTDSFLPVFTFAIFYYFQGFLFRNFFISLFKLDAQGEISSFFYMKNLSVIFYSWLFSTLYLTTMYSMRLLFDVYLAEHHYFAIEPKEDSMTLAAALSEGPEILNKLAAQDLMIMANKDRHRRILVFSLSQPGGHPTNWTNLSNQCLQIINTYCRDLNNIVSEKVNDITKSPQNPPTTSPIMLKSPHMRNLIHPYPTEIIEDIEIKSEKESFGSIIKNEIKIFFNALSKKPGIFYLFGEIPELKLKWLLLRGQTVSRVAQGLSQLVAASIHEDIYGVVQDDLASIITSFLHLKQALDKLSKSGIANKKSLRQDIIAMQMLAELKSAVKRSIYKITITFSKYVKDIPLDKEVIQGLQSFIALREG